MRQIRFQPQSSCFYDDLYCKYKRKSTIDIEIKVSYLPRLTRVLVHRKNHAIEEYAKIYEDVEKYVFCRFHPNTFMFNIKSERLLVLGEPGLFLEEQLGVLR